MLLRSVLPAARRVPASSPTTGNNMCTNIPLARMQIKVVYARLESVLMSRRKQPQTGAVGSPRD
eukprot:10426159-Lingulodinium_polyedra.AAC.1